MGRQKFRGQTPGFRPKNQEIIFLVERLRVGAGRALGKKKQTLIGPPADKIIPGLVHRQIHEFPIVQTSAFKMLVCNFEPEWLDQMQRRQSRGAKPGYTPGIGWNFRLKKNDMHQLVF